MNTEQVTPQIQNHILQMQQIQQQLQSISVQKSQMVAILNESEMALKEIESIKGSDNEIYKILGDIMIRSDKEKTTIELKDKIETLKMRIDTLKRQDERLITKFKGLQEQLKGMVGEREKNNLSKV